MNQRELPVDLPEDQPEGRGRYVLYSTYLTCWLKGHTTNVQPFFDLGAKLIESASSLSTTIINPAISCAQPLISARKDVGMQVLGIMSHTEADSFTVQIPSVLRIARKHMGIHTVSGHEGFVSERWGSVRC